MKWLLPLLLAACASSGVSDATEVALRTVYASQHCAADGPGLAIERIGDASALESAWRRHTASLFTQPPPPAVDFRQRHLLLISLGQRPTAGYSIGLAAPFGELRGRRLSIEVSQQGPSVDALKAQALTSPCALVEVDVAASRLDEVVLRDR